VHEQNGGGKNGGKKGGKNGLYIVYSIEAPNKEVDVSVSDVTKVFAKAGLSVGVVDIVPTVKPAFVIVVLAESFCVP